MARVSCRSDLTADQGLEDLESTCAVQGSAYRAVAAQSLKDILLVEGLQIAHSCPSAGGARAAAKLAVRSELDRLAPDARGSR